MKFHDQMTDEELVQLTEQQVEDCAKLLLAKDGKAFPGERPTFPNVSDKLLGKEAQFIYEVSGFFFTDQEQAQEAARSLNGSMRIESEYVGGTTYKRMPDNDDWNKATRVGVTVEMIPVYLRSTLLEVRQLDEQNEQQKTAIKEWEADYKDYVDCKKEVYNAIYAASQRIGETRRRSEYMEECLRLADNDKVIAQRFFERRYSTEIKTESEE